MKNKNKNKMMISSILVKKISLLFLIISAALFTTSFAGRVRQSVVSKAVSTSYKMQMQMQGGETWEAAIGGQNENDEHDQNERSDDEKLLIHERILKVKTNDYGRYDPAPAFVKPPFKLIPN